MDNARAPQTFPDRNEGSASEKHSISGWIGWFLLVFGVCVAALSGIVLTRAWFTRDVVNGWVGVLLLLGGTLVAVSGGMRTRVHSRPVAADEGPPERSDGPYTADVLPRLGEVLIYKYHLITEKDLQRALAKQKEFAGRPLGEILVEMGHITWRDLAKALEDQFSYGNPWKRK